jgi:threonine dehydrogenase-like Zn-dependent dehydrogenase
MGALALLTGLRAGARDVLVADVNEERLQTARQLGAAAAVNTSSPQGLAEAKRLAGPGFDLVIDASGSAPARQSALDLCRPGGLVALLGMGSQKSEIDFVTSIRKEHRVAMSFAYTPADFRRALDWLVAGEVDLSKWTVKMPLAQGQQAFDTIVSSPGSTLKMLLGIMNS